MIWLALAAVVVIGVPAAFWAGQDKLIFFPQPVASTSHLPAHAAPLAMRAADGTMLHGWIVRAEALPAPAVVYFGGNGEEVSWALADRRWPRDVTVIALNYRGYGTSEGKPSAEHLKSDGLALFDLVAARDDVDRTRSAVFGRSLGTAVATHVAAARPVARVVLVSPYDSLAAVGRTHYPFLPVSLLLRHAFAPARDAPRCRMPLLAIVAPSDAIIPAARSRALLDAWAGPKAWVEIRDADHNTLGASREFWDAVAPFLRKEPGNG
jgi:pimeloyl-ACP methyl ester carboxylesterase